MSRRKPIRRRSRPTLAQASGSYLYAGVCIALLQIVRLRFFHGYLDSQWRFVWDGLQSGVLLVLALRLGRVIRPDRQEERFRIAVPSVAQVILAFLCACAAALFLDDLTLLSGSLLQKVGLRVIRSIAPPPLHTMPLYLLRVLCSGILPAVAFTVYFHGALLCAWERRGTAYALWVSSLLGVLLCSGVVDLPAQVLLAVATGWIVVCTGSLFLSVFVRVVYAVIGIAASHVQARIGQNPARLGRIWVELGAWRGFSLLSLETCILGGMFLCTVLALCATKAKGAVSRLPARKMDREMEPATVLVLTVSVFTGVMLLLVDLLYMADLF